MVSTHVDLIATIHLIYTTQNIFFSQHKSENIVIIFLNVCSKILGSRVFFAVGLNSPVDSWHAYCKVISHQQSSFQVPEIKLSHVSLGYSLSVAKAL